MRPPDLCLVNPPQPYLVHPEAQAPLGILYLAAVAEAQGLTVSVANLAAQAGGVRPEAGGR